MLARIALLGYLATAYCWNPWYYARPDTTCIHSRSSAETSSSSSLLSPSSTDIPAPDLSTITPAGALSTLSGPVGARLGAILSPPPRPSGSTTGVCPPFTPSPATTTIILTTVIGGDLTQTSYTPTSTITVSGNTSYEYHLAVPSGNASTTTITVTTITVINQGAAVAIPTPTGFTPVACQPEYFRRTITSTSLRTRTTATTTVTLGSVATVMNYSTTVTLTYPNIPIGLSVLYTVTSTRSDPVYTFYQACATNNVVAQRPNGFIGAVLNAYDGALLSQFKEVAALNAEDCCAQCQATQCVGSVWRPPTASFRPFGECNLAFRSNGTCDSTYPGLIAEGDSIALRNYVSNGPCGELSWADFPSIQFDEGPPA